MFTQLYTRIPIVDNSWFLGWIVNSSNFKIKLQIWPINVIVLTVKRAQRKTKAAVETQGPQEGSGPRSTHRQAPGKNF